MKLFGNTVKFLLAQSELKGILQKLCKTSEEEQQLLLAYGQMELLGICSERNCQ